MNQLLPAHDSVNSPDWVSPHCRCSTTGGVSFITVRGQLMGCYDAQDQAAQRSLWVQVYQASHATQTQIARHLQISLRTFHGWVQRYRQEGMAGLLNKPKSGCPHKLDAQKQKLVWQGREAGKTVYQLAQLAQVSISTVNRILGRRQPASSSVPEPDLGLVVSVAANTLPSVACPSVEPTALAEVTVAVALTTPVPELTPRSAAKEVLEAQALIPAVVESSLPATVLAPEPKPASALASSHPGVDALDRSPDRVMARLGLLEDAEPVFAPGENLPWIGAFLGLALLANDPLLGVAGRVFGSALGKAFYGLRTTLVSLVVLALLRIKRPEQLRQHQAQGLGRVLGLDRAPEVKTLRRKLKELSQPLLGAGLLEQLARARAAQYESAARIVYVDGHVEVYTGESRIGQVYAASRKAVVKGTTRTWVNLPGGQPLLCVSSEFNEGLVAALPKVVAKVQEVLGPGALTSIFDRGGYSGLLFEQQSAAGHGVITYRRGKVAAWPLEKFLQQPTQIGHRKYAYAPAEATVEIPVYEPTAVATGKKGAPKRGKTGRTVSMREIRVVRPDGGQTSILAVNTNASAVEICGLMFARWGAQENVFKYLLAEYDLDATVEHGDEPLSADITHPNPAYVQKQKTLAKWVGQRDKHLAKLGVKLTAEPLSTEALSQVLAEWKRRPQAAKAQAAQAQIENLRGEMASLPERVSAGASGIRRLKSEMKLLTIALKLTAYHLETQLLERLRPHYSNHANEGRKLIAAALRSPGSIRLEPGKILVRLAPQASPNRTKAIAKLCEGLNQLKPVYPGTNLRIEFENPAG